MSRPRVQDSQAKFSGGLNSVASEFNVGPTQVRRAENVLLSQYGDAIRRGGTQRMSASAIAAAPVRGATCWRTATTHEYLAACNGTLYSGGTYAIPMTWTSKGALTSSSAYPSFQAFRDGSGEVCYIADGALLKYSAGALSAVGGGTPALTVLAVYNQRLFGLTGTNQTLYYSDLNNGDTCGVTSATSGSAVVRTFGNQQLTGLLTLRGSLALFHVSGVSRFTGLTQDDIAIGAGTQGISTDTGTIAPRSAVAVEGVGYFLSEKGAYRITDAGVEAIDTPESPDPTAPILATLGASLFPQIDAVHDKVHQTIRWYLPDLGVYCYHYRLNAWSGPFTSIYVDSPTHTLVDGIDASGNPIVLSGHADGYLRRDDTTGASGYLDDVLSDDSGGSAYTMAVTCRRFYTNDQASDKGWRWAWLFADLKGSTQASVSWASESGASTLTLSPKAAPAVWGSFTWGSMTWGSTGNRPYEIPLSGRGPFLDFTYSDSGATGTILSRLDVEAFDYGRRG
ncbi:hypothetical protein [Humibacter sp.]|uniref:hypothetical protein n=1 Tax=Humibacter sp. TaxID=1940291 RepID=UPI003F805445